MRLINLILLALIMVISVLFVSLNANPVAVNYVLGQGEFPLAVMMVIALVIGMCFSVLLVGVPFMREKWRSKLLQRKLASVETKLLHYRDQVAKEN